MKQPTKDALRDQLALAASRQVALATDVAALDEELNRIEQENRVRYRHDRLVVARAAGEVHRLRLHVLAAYFIGVLLGWWAL